MLKNVKRFLCVILSTFLVIMGVGAAVSSTASATVATYYVDSVNGNDSNNGISESTAWKTIGKVNSCTFAPGDTILFKAGRSFSGELRFNSSGTSGNPIVIDKYGTGANPTIVGPGTSNSAAIHLYNQQYITIQNLILTNPGTTDDYRSGIIIEGEGAGILNSITLQNLEITNIRGYYQWVADQRGHEKRFWNAGIFVLITDPNKPVTKFNNLTIQNNNIHDIREIGVLFVSAYNAYDYAPSKWHTNVAIRNNTLNRVGGDSIIVGYCDGPVIENNIAYDSGYGLDSQVNVLAGIWGYNMRNAVFQFNECGRTVLYNGDGEPWDTDWGTFGNTVYQYNYSRDNQGGVLLDMCNYGYNGTEPINPVFRYNISQNDHNGFFNCTTNKLTAYNNIVYNPYGSINIPGSGNKFYNNIFVGNTSSFSANNTYDYNCYFGGLAAPNDSHKVAYDPRFENPGTGAYGINSVAGYQLKADSPCLNTGKVIASNGNRDYWGNSLYYGNPDIGPFEYQSNALPPVYISNPVIINDTDAGITYTGTWGTDSNRGFGDYNNDVHWTRTNNNFFQYSFTGTGVEYITEKNSDQGNVDIYIDGVFQQTVNCYNASRLAKQVMYGKTGLSQGTHTIKGVKTSGTYMLVDAFKVYR